MSNNTKTGFPGVIVVVPEDQIKGPRASQEPTIIPAWMRTVVFTQNSPAKTDKIEPLASMGWMEALVSIAWITPDLFVMEEENDRTIPYDEIREYADRIKEALDFLRIPNIRLPIGGAETSDLVDRAIGETSQEQLAYYAEVTKYLPMVKMEVIQEIIAASSIPAEIRRGPWAIVRCAYGTYKTQIEKCLDELIREEKTSAP